MTACCFAGHVMNREALDSKLGVWSLACKVTALLWRVTVGGLCAGLEEAQFLALASCRNVGS